MTAATPSCSVATALRESVRYVQTDWAARSIRERLRFVQVLRRLVAENAEALAAAAGQVRGVSSVEKLVSEVLPLAEACRWLERNAANVLAPRRYGSQGRPFWLRGLRFEIVRKPLGLILIIAPANYPLFLPGVQALQSLVAGNAVRLKPAPGARDVALGLARLAFEAGLEPELLEVLDDSTAAGKDAVEDGADKVIFTGSASNGRDVLARLARTNTPSVMELSGDDAVIVLADADLDLVARAIRFGLRLNHGETCIAPRRLFVVESVADELSSRLDGQSGIRVQRVRDAAEAISRANESEFGLGASIFSRDTRKAKALAALMKTGFVLINDLIAATADARMPFGGVKGSGFGATRGAEGLLEMTTAHVIADRRGRFRPHFEGVSASDSALFTAAIRFAHGGRRLPALAELVRAIGAKLLTKTSKL